MDKAIKILKQEIDWHRKHTGIGRIGGKTDDWVDGFIHGCEHCLAVLTSATRADVDTILTKDAADSEGRCRCGEFPHTKLCPLYQYKERN